MNNVPTAYSEATARDYDAKRFTNKSGRILHALEVRRLHEAIEIVGDEFYALEVGCGTGRFTRLVAAYARELVAIEPSDSMMNLAMQKCNELNNISFESGEGAKIRYPNGTFDFAFSIRVTNQTESREYALKLVDEMLRVTKESGFVLVEACNADRWFQRSSQTVRLGSQDFQSIEGVTIRQLNGLLVMSLTVLSALRVAPSPIINFFVKIDELISRRWPWTASRIYILLQKNRMLDES